MSMDAAIESDSFTIAAASRVECRRSAYASAAGPDGEDAFVRCDDIPRAGQEQGGLLVGHDEEGLELAQRLLRAPVGRELDGRSLELAVKLLELALEPREQRHGVRCRAREAREDLPAE